MFKRKKSLRDAKNQNHTSPKLLRNILKMSVVVFLLGVVAYSPITQNAANNNLNQPHYELSFDMETVKMISGESVEVRVNIERYGFEDPVTLKAENLPDGFEIEFQENPVEDDFTTAVIYSPANVLQCENPIVVDSYENPEPNAKLRVMVNCGIEWDEQIGSQSGDAYHIDEDIGNAITTDISGNVYLVGNTFSTVDPQYANQGNSDVWVAKYTNNGTFEWISQVGSEGEDIIAEVAVDNDLNVFIGGHTRGSMPNNTNRGNADYWIAKYNSGGGREWIVQSGGLSPNEAANQDGKFGMTIIPDNQGGARIATLINERTGVAVFDYDNDGNVSYVGGGDIPTEFRNSPRDLALSENGDLYIVGFQNVNGPKRGYILKYDINGGTQRVWTRNDLFITGELDATRVIIDSSGDLFVAGTDVISGSDTNAWFGKFSSTNGALLWSNYVKLSSQLNKEDRINTLGINSDGDLVVAGSTTGVLGTRNGGGEDAWSARYDSSNGDLVWFNQYAVNGDDSFEAVAFDNNDGVFFAGRTVNWKNNIGSTDALLVKFVDSVPNLITPNITNAQQDPNYPGLLRIQGANLINVTEVRVNGVPFGVISSSPESLTALIPMTFPRGLDPLTLSVGANCHTLTKSITIPN